MSTKKIYEIHLNLHLKSKYDLKGNVKEMTPELLPWVLFMSSLVT